MSTTTSTTRGRAPYRAREGSGDAGDPPPSGERARRPTAAQARGAWTTYALLGLAAIWVLLPLYAIVAVSLQPQDAQVSGLSWPSDPQWGNYAEAFRQGVFGPLLTNSLKIAVSVALLGTTVSILAGYAFATMEFRFKKPLFVLLLIGLVLPFEGMVLPLFYNLRAFGLTNSAWSVVLPEAALYSSFGIFWMRVAFAAVPSGILEAARVDGASTWRILRSIMLPVSLPSIATLLVLQFLWSWNEFLIALIMLQDPSSRTAPAGLGAFVGEYSVNIPLLAAGAVIVSTPPVLLYAFMQRFVISGLTQGAVKG
ncbi:carbohydrate ABC transporter permease [Nocardioides bruguierae]|uniref:carbohydrate ABC transporter permease n=1 Tax=Nocardioides bruguierae TaxID=2945102 RepID=UPI0020210E91|nr:carbohydrate ABC transporter permease [Nocardioides bruguierae]MCL8024474.1 carbohydrate ABC transporter permease [Nocardioides bruguierae]